MCIASTNIAITICAVLLEVLQYTTLNELKKKNELMLIWHLVKYLKQFFDVGPRSCPLLSWQSSRPLLAIIDWKQCSAAPHRRPWCQKKKHYNKCFQNSTSVMTKTFHSKSCNWIYYPSPTAYVGAISAERQKLKPWLYQALRYGSVRLKQKRQSSNCLGFSLWGRKSGLRVCRHFLNKS